MAVEVDSGYKVGNARVNKGSVASKGKFCGWISDDGVLELLEGRRRNLSHCHYTASIPTAIFLISRTP